MSLSLLDIREVGSAPKKREEKKREIEEKKGKESPKVFLSWRRWW